jgi:hypothetical protein
MYQEKSRYVDHPRITWFGTHGSVAYVDYISATESYFIGSDGRGGFQVIPPGARTDTDDDIVTGFETIDAGIEYALAEADKGNA